MNINFFEGARRVRYVILGCGALIGLAVTLTSIPTPTIYYVVNGVGARPVKVPDRVCGYKDATQSIEFKSERGKAAVLDLCFKAIQMTTGDMLVPYRSSHTPTTVGYGESWSSEVRQYSTMFSMTVKPSVDDRLEADTKYWFGSATHIGLGVGQTIFWLGIFWLVTEILGWIVRGFFGIPNGQDKRPSSVTTA